MNKLIIPFQSLTKELKAIINDPLSDYDALETELKKLKYSNGMRKSAKHHFKQLRELLKTR